jgi:hypothetical protein
MYKSITALLTSLLAAAAMAQTAAPAPAPASASAVTVNPAVTPAPAATPKAEAPAKKSIQENRQEKQKVQKEKQGLSPSKPRAFRGPDPRQASSQGHRQVAFVIWAAQKMSTSAIPGPWLRQRSIAAAEPACLRNSNF